VSTEKTEKLFSYAIRSLVTPPMWSGKITLAVVLYEHGRLNVNG